MNTRSTSRRVKSPSNDRRQTLGPVPNSTNKNSRESLGGVPPTKGRSSRASMLPRVGRENAFAQHSSAAPSVANASTDSSRRKSVGVPNIQGKQRRQTLAPQPTSYVVPRDPRNINDKGYQHQCMKRLLNYLIEKGYDQPISMKTLKMPSGKDFGSIITFMLRRLDPNFQSEETKFEDEVSATLKSMCYPYPVSKTALVSAGSPHTWPNLLALLSWLMDQLESIESDQMEQGPTNEEETTVYESVEDLEDKSDKVFFKFLASSYQAFLKGDDAAAERLETALIEHCERDNNFLAQEVDRITDLNARILEQINEGRDQSEEIKVLIKKREDYATDLEQYQDLVKQMTDNKLSFVQKLEEQRKKLQDVNSKIERLRTITHDMEQKIKEQKMSVEDAKKLEVEQKSRKEALERVRNKRKELDEEHERQESILATMLGEIEDVVASYNTMISEMSVVPLVGPIYRALKAELCKDNLLDSDQESIIGVDLCGNVQETIKSHQPQVDRRIQEKDKSYQDALDKIQKQDNTTKEAAVKLSILHKELEKKAETLQHEHDAYKAKLAVRQREVDAMEQKVEALRDPMALEEQIASLERQCAELEALQMTHQDENINLKQSALRAIADGCNMMEEHEVFVRRASAKVKDFWAQQKATLRKIAPCRKGD
ncbi:hypothetical protein ACA910_005286 [Epithemia clementina (nom. ined.)]